MGDEDLGPNAYDYDLSGNPPDPPAQQKHCVEIIETCRKGDSKNDSVGCQSLSPSPRVPYPIVFATNETLVCAGRSESDQSIIIKMPTPVSEDGFEI